ncbi:heat shock protein, partial [Tanacetum coccineum]
KIAEEACEKWRLRGNQAYSNGDLAKAEDYYTKGLNSVSQNEKSRGCLKALMLCCSNRAATRISLGRMKEALGDCLMASNIDPGLQVAAVAASFTLAFLDSLHARMGEIASITAMFKVMKATPPIPETMSPDVKEFLCCCFVRNPVERPMASIT